MVVITSAINAHLYIEILNNFLIPSIENWFSHDEVIFDNDKASGYCAKGMKAFIQERDIKSMTWLV